MAEAKTMRLSQVARKLNVGTVTIIEHLSSKGIDIENKPNTKVTADQYDLLLREFKSSAIDKEEATEITIGTHRKDTLVINNAEEEPKKEEPISAQPVNPEPEPEKHESKLPGLKVVGKIDLNKKEEKKKEEVKEEVAPKEEIIEKKEEPIEEAPVKTEEKELTTPNTPETPEPENQLIEGRANTLKGLTVVGKITLPKKGPSKKDALKPVASSDKEDGKDKRKRKRVRIIEKPGSRKPGRGAQQKPTKEEPSDKEVREQIKATLARLSGSKGPDKGRSKYRREKRSAVAEAKEELDQLEQEQSKTLHVSEFVSANDLASLMDVSVNDVISTCMSLGMFVSINQRLDAEAITVITDEFGFGVKFSNDEEEVTVETEEDLPEDLSERAPIVTVMGHVDHGKTSLLDYIRSAKTAAGEAGGITQHIGAYSVVTDEGKKITFLDTPGHEAFTAMRARGAKLTDIVVIVVAADDSVMPQTKEAINHAQIAGVPIVIAINKMDKPGANPDKVKEELSKNNVLVEDWGGKYQCELVSAKTGQGIAELLEKVLLEAELKELKANPNKNAVGTVVEASLDKGRGYVATLLVQGGTLRVGDILLAGAHHGRVKAMTDHLGRKVEEAGPAIPVQVLGLDGAPQAGDKFNVTETEREAREIAAKREQILREQSIRTKKHITLDEIGRRLAIGSFKELNVIVKADVDGSLEALSDSLLKLSTEEIQVNIIHKAVGQISESDVLLASASDAVIVGFQVRPSVNARKLADKEEIEIRLYSVIYDAINEVKDAMEGMLAPTTEEVITGNAEVRDVFKISRVGTIAGCYVTDGTIKRSNQVRLIRDGIVVYTGNLTSLKRFKDDVTEVKSNYECGIGIKDFNDIKPGDVVEGFEEKEVKRTL